VPLGNDRNLTAPASTSAISAAFSSGVHCRRRSTTISPSTLSSPSGQYRRARLPSARRCRPQPTGRFRPDAYASAAR
jgi:hypothetical protein